LRKALAAVLAVPVLASVYLAPLWRRPILLRVPLALTSVGLMTLALMPASGPAGTDSVVVPPEASAVRQVRPLDDRSAPDLLASLAADVPELRLAWAHDPDRPGLGALDSLAARPIERPTIVRHRPFAGTAGVDPNALVSIRFSESMLGRPTERALRISGLDPLADGRLYWVEEGTVLVFDPDRPLEHSRRYEVSLLGSALSRDGVAMSDEHTQVVLAYTFRVAAEVVPLREPPAQKPAEPVRPSTSGSGWAWPLDGPITQYFGESRTAYGYHTGIDIDGTTGDPVRAAHAGTVTVAGVHDECSGLQVTIRHADGLESWYRHLSALSVRVGEEVARGELVGRVGDTGCSLGSHLHFAVRRGSTWLDPLDYLPRR
jgi:hypothetical protein